MDAFLSFRPLIQEKILPFSARFGEMDSTAAAILLEAVVNVSNFKEEGQPLAPVVFLTTDLGELLKVVHGASPVSVGQGVADEATARMALKSCIPLGEGRQWAVYLHLTGGVVQYGVFCTDRSPLRVTSFEALRLSKDSSGIVGITRLGENLVEICAGHGMQQYLDFSGASDLTTHPGKIIREFARAVTKDSAPELRQQFEAFFYRIGVEIFSGAHGVLAAVQDANKPQPQFLADGIWLNEPVNIGMHSNKDATFLLAHSDLMRRMMTMDGIVVFSSAGCLLAYNCFIREQVVGPPSRSTPGGARRRAYEILASQVGSALTAAFYRSQDGFGECKVRRA